MIIEQSKEQVEDTIGFHARAEIGSLRLTRARVSSRERITQATAQGVDFDINFRPGTCSLEDGALFLETDFVFSISGPPKDGPDEHTPLILIECSFEAEYHFKDYTPSEKQIEAFRSANAVFNCWPFFREFVQASATRMHFPPPPVPFLKLVRKTEQTPPAPPVPPAST